MKPVRNPELEQIRNSVLSEKVDHSSIASQLETASQGLHASFLFHPEGRRVLKNMCTIMSATPPAIEYTSWKDLGGALGLTFHQIGCIENYKHNDSTELVLKAYAQKAESTIDTIIQVLHNLQRYDILTTIRSPLLELSEYVKREYCRRGEDVDNGYCSLTEGTGQPAPPAIIRPDGYHHLHSQLYITLQDPMAGAAVVSRLSPPPQPPTSNSDEPSAVTLYPLTSVDTNCTATNESLQRSCVVEPATVAPVQRQKERRCARKVMLTFAEDGAELALQLARELRRERFGNKRIGVLILEDHTEVVQSNPHKFVTHYFHKVDFIVPIVTEGYLDALHGQNGESIREQHSLSAQYVQFIHDLMTNYYVHNSCRNDKFRCVIPDDQLKTILSNTHWRTDPVLGVFFSMTNIDTLATRILTSRRSNQS